MSAVGAGRRGAGRRLERADGGSGSTCRRAATGHDGKDMDARTNCRAARLSASTPTSARRTDAGDAQRLRRDALLAPRAGAARRQGRRLLRPVRLGDVVPGRRLRPHARRPARRRHEADRVAPAVHAGAEGARRGDRRPTASTCPSPSANNTDATRARSHLTPDRARRPDTARRQAATRSCRRARRGPSAAAVLRFRPTLIEGTASLRLEGTHGAVPRRHPRARSGWCRTASPSPARRATCWRSRRRTRSTLPTWLPGTLKVRVDVYPSTLADLQKGLEGLLARAARLLRAVLDGELSQRADPRLPARRRQGRPGAGEAHPRAARPRLPEADLVRVPGAGQATPARLRVSSRPPGF